MAELNSLENLKKEMNAAYESLQHANLYASLDGCINGESAYYVVQRAYERYHELRLKYLQTGGKL